jgi:hypothetical protein
MFVILDALARVENETFAGQEVRRVTKADKGIVDEEIGRIESKSHEPRRSREYQQRSQPSPLIQRRRGCRPFWDLLRLCHSSPKFIRTKECRSWWRRSSQETAPAARPFAVDQRVPSDYPLTVAAQCRECVV